MVAVGGWLRDATLLAYCGRPRGSFSSFFLTLSTESVRAAGFLLFNNTVCCRVPTRALPFLAGSFAPLWDFVGLERGLGGVLVAVSGVEGWEV